MTKEDKHQIRPVVYRCGPSSLVDKITVNGLERTQIGLVLREFEALDGINDINEVYQALEQAHGALMSLDAFDAVDIVLDQSAKDEKKISVSVTASELGMVGLNAGTYVQGSEGTVEATLNIRNYTGYAEKVSLSVEQGLSHSNVYATRLSIPRVFRLPYHVDWKVHQIFDNKEKWSSYVERLRGMTVSVISDDGTRSLSYESGWRTLSDPSKRASGCIVKSLGESLKSSLTFSFASTAFDDNPKAAGSTVTSVEVGGIGTNGPCQFIKGSVSSHLSFELTDTSELNIEGTMGVIIPSRWGSSASIGPCDRFFMGGLGPYGLRGFHQHGVGPMSARRKDGLPKNERQFDSLGGSFLLSLMAALRFQMPFPTLSALGMQGQIFVNSGTLGNIGEGNFKSPVDISKICRNDIRTTVGVGIVWPLSIGQLEFNVCRVMRKGQHDYSKNGFQFGITPY